MTVDEERERIWKIIQRHYEEQSRKGMFGARVREVLDAIVCEINAKP